MGKKALGVRLADARKESGFTSERLALECDVSAVYIRQIESGRYQPSITTLMKLGKSFTARLIILYRTAQSEMS